MSPPRRRAPANHEHASAGATTAQSAAFRGLTIGPSCYRSAPCGIRCGRGCPLSSPLAGNRLGAVVAQMRGPHKPGCTSSSVAPNVARSQKVQLIASVVPKSFLVTPTACGLLSYESNNVTVSMKSFTSSYDTRRSFCNRTRPSTVRLG